MGELAHAYAAISYYLQQREAVEAYLRERRELAARVRRENERRWPAASVRERLLARRRDAASVVRE